MPDFSLLAIMVIFIMTYMVVRKFFLEPISNVLDAREHETKTAEQAFEEAMARFSEATSQIEERVHLAKRDAAQRRDQLRGEASARRATMIEKTSAEAKSMVSEADTKLGQDVKVAREKIITESESLARMAAERILGRSV